jgi:phosphatidylserine/phosphatidylglycerophosphate/cardiolipin synthase-like enzyme
MQRNHPANPSQAVVLRGSGILSSLVLGSLVPVAPVQSPVSTGHPGIGQGAAFELIESTPTGIDLDAPDLRDTAAAWCTAIASAERTIDLAHFYCSEPPVSSAAGSKPASRLTAVLAALEAAAARGVRVRLLLASAFRDTYPEPATTLGRQPGIELRWLDLEPHTGGVLHAKYFLVDGRRIQVGSANLDWRSLEHIQELGLSLDCEPVARHFGAVFEHDWALAGGEPFAAPELPPALQELPDGTRLRAVFSPASLCPPGTLWDLPLLIAAIDGARHTVAVQLLSYRPSAPRGDWFDDLDRALRRAAARGVDVRLLVADWDQRPGRVEALQSLQPMPGIAVRWMTIPPAPEGHIPFARVIHAKYLVVDGQAAWLGSSNWSRDYFEQSRNAGLLVEGGPLPARLQAFHTRNWESVYAYDVDPGASYPPPRIGE